MSKTSIFKWVKKNLAGTIVLGAVLAYSQTVFFTLYGIMYYRTYSSKQYSKWSLWLFYISTVAILAHFTAAGEVFEYVYYHIGDHKYKLPSLARQIFGVPALFIILSFFFMPKFIKDTLKLKQEQELTI